MCILAVLNNESVFAFFQQSFSRVLLFFLYAALKNTSFSQVVWKTEVSTVTSSSETI